MMWFKWRGLVLAGVNTFSSTVFFFEGWWAAGIIWGIVAILCLAGFVVERVDEARSRKVDSPYTQRQEDQHGQDGR